MDRLIGISEWTWEASALRDLLSKSDRREALSSLAGDGWEPTGDGSAIRKEFAFRTFSEAFAWMTRVAMLAEKLGHHPDWSNTYNKVTVELTTHSAGGLTELDFRLARQIERIG